MKKKLTPKEREYKKQIQRIDKSLEYDKKYEPGCWRRTSSLEHELYVDRNIDVFKPIEEIIEKIKNYENNKKAINDLFSYITTKTSHSSTNVSFNEYENPGYDAREHGCLVSNATLTLEDGRKSIKRRRKTLKAMMKTPYLKEEILKRKDEIKQSLKQYRLIEKNNNY